MNSFVVNRCFTFLEDAFVAFSGDADGLARGADGLVGGLVGVLVGVLVGGLVGVLVGVLVGGLVGGVVAGLVGGLVGFFDVVVDEVVALDLVGSFVCLVLFPVP